MSSVLFDTSMDVRKLSFISRFFKALLFEISKEVNKLLVKLKSVSSIKSWIPVGSSICLSFSLRDLSDEILLVIT